MAFVAPGGSPLLLAFAAANFPLHLCVTFFCNVRVSPSIFSCGVLYRSWRRTLRWASSSAWPAASAGKRTGQTSGRRWAPEGCFVDLVVLGQLRLNYWNVKQSAISGGGNVVRKVIRTHGGPKKHIFPHVYLPYLVLITLFPGNTR